MELQAGADEVKQDYDITMVGRALASQGRNMLVIISDTHLTDGSSGKTVREGAFKVFRDTLRDLAYDASCRADGTYKPITELHLLLLGDILDVIRSRRWLEGALRPWSSSSDLGFVHKVAEITEHILQHNAPSLELLRCLDAAGDVTIPPATLDGQPKNVEWEPWNSQRQRVKVHRHYMVGNHDWFYHLSGPEYDSIRASIVKALGLENPPDKPFPWDPVESDMIQEVCRAHGVFARHGDVYDHDNFNPQRGRDNSSIGDAIVVELLSRFHVEVEEQLGGRIPPECIEGLNELDNVRPSNMSVVWISGLLDRTCPKAADRAKVKQIWNKLVSEFLSARFVKRQHSSTKLIWRFSRWMSLRALSWVLLSRTGQRFKLLQSHPTFDDAMREPAFSNRSAKFVVFGHTHEYKLVPLVSTGTGPAALEQIYINSGTWRPYNELARHRPQHHQFVGYELMTMLAFYKAGERGGHSFETWNGTLSLRTGSSSVGSKLDQKMRAINPDAGARIPGASDPRSRSG